MSRLAIAPLHLAPVSRALACALSEPYKAVSLTYSLHTHAVPFLPRPRSSLMTQAAPSHTARGGHPRKRWTPPAVLSCLDLSDEESSSSGSTPIPPAAAPPRAKKQRQSKTQAVKALQRSRDKTETPPPSKEPSKPPQDPPGPRKNPARKALKAPRAPPLNMDGIRTNGPRDVPERPSPRVFDIEHCPIYTPTYEEFTKPMEYVEKIARQAKEYGICKIVPPEGWRPPFVLDTEVSLATHAYDLVLYMCPPY
jgi:hypothetical protein